MTYEEQVASLKRSFSATLARIVGCPLDELPAAVSREEAATFLDLKNPKTIDVWKSTQRYPLVFIKVGRRYRVGSDSLVSLMVDRAEIPASLEGAA